MTKPIMLASWAFAVTSFHGWATAVFLDWAMEKCVALGVCAFVWGIAGTILSILWSDKQSALREKREREEEKRR